MRRFHFKRFLVKLEVLIKDHPFDFVNLKLEVPTLKEALESTPSHMTFKVTSTDQQDITEFLNEVRYHERQTQPPPWCGAAIPSAPDPGALDLTDETTTPLSNSGAKPGLVQNAQNDYWFATLGVGYALNKNTDLLADYSYYSADNYAPGNYRVGVPYGAGATEHVLSVGLAHRISRNLRCSLRYAYFQSEDETSGDHNNFSAHVISTGLQYRF